MMEFGVGHHGEAGTKVEELKSASEICTGNGRNHFE